MRKITKILGLKYKEKKKVGTRHQSDIYITPSRRFLWLLDSVKKFSALAVTMCCLCPF